MIKRACSAVAANLLFAQIDIDSLGIDFDSGVADGGQNASPVWISARPCGLYQRRIGYRAADLPRFTPRTRLLDIQAHHVLYAFAVGHDLCGQRAANFRQCRLKLISHGFELHAALAAGQQQAPCRLWKYHRQWKYC